MGDIVLLGQYFHLFHTPLTDKQYYNIVGTLIDSLICYLANSLDFSFCFAESTLQLLIWVYNVIKSNIVFFFLLFYCITIVYISLSTNSSQNMTDWGLQL